ncbi:hypothetical protein TIFTF001_024078 [Ficus carica]|uniref:VQ domain-containing protein n=1 Tax=Ficus carica TaxID=3494 RepID=A0AA88AXS8_FICCA|nr:hypothetical protein TIFTF001_024078 [Ficus carica]
MGKNKKASSQAASVKASRNSNHEKKKKDFSNWIKVLRPKVYITDSSSFKRLVQDLTGNASTSPAITSEPEERRLEKVPIYDNQGEPESSVEASIDATTADSSDQVFLDQDFNQACNYEIGLEDMNYYGNSAPNQQQGGDLLACWDLESWLLDSAAPCTSFYNGFADQVEQDVSIYDYELSGFL